MLGGSGQQLQLALITCLFSDSNYQNTWAVSETIARIVIVMVSENVH